MHIPITAAKGLELANSLIESQSTEKTLEWKAKNCHAFKLNYKQVG
jgi:hypothetical protein